VGNGYVGLLVAMEPTDETIPGIRTPLEEAHLRLNGLYNPRFENMEKAVFRQMEEHGARIFLNVEYHFHSSHQKVS
jgi:hypothetical protein